MRLLFVLGALGASAFPTMPDFVEERGRTTTPAVIVSREETNCGPTPCSSFSGKDQLVSVHGYHRWEFPKDSQIRGPCPGLNAAANHAYFPRSGILSIEDTVNGLSELYSFADNFAAALAVFSIIISGDIVGMRWSIGGPPPYANPGGLLYPPQGISYSHNKYEGDVSIGRNDAYLNNGNAYTMNVTRFKYAYEAGLADDRFTPDKFRRVFGANVERSVNENPYYFSPPLAGAIVPPAAYQFVINFMSNHSEEEKSGYLDGSIFKSFFSVTGDYPHFKYTEGGERVPENWYKRPSTERYGALTLGEDDAIQWAAYPDSLRIGGNTHGVDTYEGVDVAQLTDGAFSRDGIIKGLKGENLACLAFQAEEQVLPDELKGGVNDASAAVALFKKFFSPLISELECKPLKKYNAALFNKFPGYHYSPMAPTNGNAGGK